MKLEISDSKYCKRCDKIYPLTEDYFYPARRMGENVGSWQSYCKTCWKAINKDNKEKRAETKKRQEIIDSYFIRIPNA